MNDRFTSGTFSVGAGGLFVTLAAFDEDGVDRDLTFLSDPATWWA